MKYRPSKRVVWLIIPLLPLLMIFIGLWASGKREAADRATRGAKPPVHETFALASPSTWDTAFARPHDWYDEGMETFMKWNFNPWAKKRNYFGRRVEELFYAKFNPNKPENLEEHLRLRKAAKDWYDRILARYPELAVEKRNLPDSQNALLQWRNLLDRLRKGESAEKTIDIGFLKEFKDHFGNKKDWNPEAARTWIDANRSLLDEVRRIAMMPDESSYQVASGYYSDFVTRDLCQALLMDARLAAEQGDISRALDSIRAANGIADHLKNGEAPARQEMASGFSIQQTIAHYVLSQILPTLPPEQVDAAAWENAVNPKPMQPADLSRLIRGDWNQTMQENLLPKLSDATDPAMPSDPDALAEAYTRYMKAQALQFEDLAPTDLANVTEMKSEVSDLSWRSRQIANDLGITGDEGLLSSWKSWQTTIGMNQAAFAILKGEPVPKDPIYGKPYVWDPVTRQLSAPAGREFEKIRYRITVPKH